MCTLTLYVEDPLPKETVYHKRFVLKKIKFVNEAPSDVKKNHIMTYYVSDLRVLVLYDTAGGAARLGQEGV
jgi:hypothetical protein